MSKTPTKPLILVDGSSYLYRAFHALPPLTNSKGEPTGAIYGVISMLKKLIKDYDPEFIAVVFDPKGRTFRDDLFAEYKAHRPSMPDDLQRQVQPLFEVIKSMGLPLIIIDGVEADDVIGTLACHARKHHMPVVISTGDKDMAQLVDEEITLVNTMSNKIYDVAGVIEKFGIPPEKMIDYLALIGDSVDNVPGIPQVGPKTAVKWLTEYGSLDNIILHASEVKGKIGENLRQFLPQLELSKALVTIKLDVELPFDFVDLKKQAEDKTSLLKLYSALEFKSWVSELQKQPELMVQQAVLSESADEIIVTEQALSELIIHIKRIGQFSVLLHTHKLNNVDADLIGISIGTGANNAYYIPIGHYYLEAEKQLDLSFVLEKLSDLMEDPNITKISHDIKSLFRFLTQQEILLRGKYFDTMIEAFLISSSSRIDIDTLSLKYLNHQNTLYESLAGKGAKEKPMSEIMISDMGRYGAEHARMIYRLHETLYTMIQQEKGLLFVLEHIELPLIPILSMMEHCGVLVDAHKLQKQGLEIADKLAALEREAFALAEGTFNLSSPKQLQEVLFDKMGLPVVQKTPTGQPSTSEEVLAELAKSYPLPQIILDYRSLAKIKTTYTDKLPLQIHASTDRIHTCYHQVGAATGRFSSSDPNLQNIPIRSLEGRKIRQAFIAPKGYKIIAADYSQIELRIMAHLSQDKGLCKAFASGLDIHTATAAEVFNVSLDEVTANHRRNAKVINFGLIYGMSAFGLAKTLDVGRHEAQMFMDNYFARYPGVKLFMDSIRSLAHEQGYVETVFGRRLYIPEINSRNKAVQSASERVAVNAPMQGTAADIIKLAMINMDQAMRESTLDMRMIMQVHDELVFEVNESQLKEAEALIKSTMINAASLSVPLEVDVTAGENWDEAHS